MVLAMLRLIFTFFFAITFPVFGAPDPNPARFAKVSDHHARMLQRPAVQRALAYDRG